MKRQLLLFIVSLLVLSASAQTSDRKWAAGVGSGIYGALGESSLGYMPEFYISRYFNPSLDFYISQNFGLANNKIESNLDVSLTTIAVRYKFYNGIILPESSVLKPYVFAGPGYISDNNVNKINFNLGLGAKYPIKRNISLYAQVGYVNGAKVNEHIETWSDDNVVVDRLVPTYRDNLWKATVGIEITIGGSKDSDGDGVPDKKDKCPNTPRDVFVDENGCPIDTDNDGVIDHLDECPTEPGPSSTSGCPDADGDGIPDKDDACPDVKGKKEFNGCPDPNAKKEDEKKTEPSQMTAAEAVKSGNMRVLDIKVRPVYFVVDQSYLTDYTKNKIANLVDMLLKNPAYLVRLWGYTDDLASADYNQKLSEKRAESVMRFMTSMGFDRSRIVSTNGLGEENPVAPNNTEQNRRLNRRVEFEIFVAE
ncbi:OmpA family protein [Mangrovibacterium diazotrophicum]|uniref:Outer membrane protein OmpA-like peptidoglycan-associated protein n=1 Tax=Mangrovibacterium diazotrophicum TaxID=1261403 RepID=A0A419VYA7_9BACT|nr:OmpA family protein [Mangrovibacterium diazotrophicum]RKD88217.1 outer membrane protein OmpA-like peptidoglycan-associated protein [Mangrovibacterium diazotrophicum]